MPSTIALDAIPHYAASCLETHLGLWCVDEQWANGFMALLQNGVLQAYLARGDVIAPVDAKDPRGYDVYGSTAMVPLVGALSPGGSSFGGGSTIAFRRGLRAAARDPDIANIVAYINSPGGVVEGTREAAQDIERLKAIKPITAHIQDQGTSAAYYIASTATRMTANEAAFVGNIGVRAQILDTSTAFEQAGIKSVLFSTGPFKAIGVPGEPVTDEQRDHIQHLINETFELFAETVQRGRRLSDSQMPPILQGKTYTAKEALALGLIDEIADIESVLSSANARETEMVDKTRAQQVLHAIWPGSRFQVETDAPVASDPDAQEPQLQMPLPDPAPAPKVEKSTETPYVLAEIPVMGTGEPTYADGVQAEKAEAERILELCILRHGQSKAALVALEHIRKGANPEALQRQFVTERVLDSKDDPAELSTAHLPSNKVERMETRSANQTVLRPAHEVAAERDAIAAQGRQHLRQV